MEKERYDSWSPLIPRVNQVVQLHFADATFETTVRTRSTKDQETYYITVDSPYPEQDKMELYICPNASAIGMIDKSNDRKPFWRLSSMGGDDPGVKLFFLD
jgi:hypothetical protein